MFSSDVKSKVSKFIVCNKPVYGDEGHSKYVYTNGFIIYTATKIVIHEQYNLKSFNLAYRLPNLTLSLFQDDSLIA